jgi:hypothetical protein
MNTVAFAADASRPVLVAPELGNGDQNIKIIAWRAAGSASPG